MNQELLHYLQNQIRTTGERARRFTHDTEGNAYPQRFMYVKLKQYIDDFLSKKSMAKMVVIPGFRGVGKTTLMAQVSSAYHELDVPILFLSVEDAQSLFNVGIAELMAAYEEILGEDLERVTAPVLVFLDEIQSDPKWALTLKSLYERTSKFFFCCTGSSAVVLQMTTNLARRAIFEKLPPMCFTEFEMIQNGVFPVKELKSKLKQAIYFSPDAASVCTALNELRPQVNQYWSKVSRRDIRDYLSYGTLPFALMMPNMTTVFDSISLLLDKMIWQDLPMLGRFDVGTLSVVKRILFAIAENDATSLSKLEEKFGMSRLTISGVFDALEKAELLLRIPAYGSNMTIAKKPNKYLFMSPAIRTTFFSFTGDENTYLTRQGKLLEDSIGAHLMREFIMNDKGAIRYDSAEGGADFILQILNEKRLIVEVGMGEKRTSQVVQSMKGIKADYGLVFSAAELSLDVGRKIVTVPLDFYFLM